MAFAINLKTSREGLSECKYIHPSKVNEIQSMLKQGDWRDELIRSLKGELEDIDIVLAAPGLGARIRDDSIEIHCIGINYLIDKKGNIIPEPRNKWISILLLHYIRNKGKGEFTGQWMSFSELKGGLVKSSTFKRDCEEPLRELFDNLMDRINPYLEMIGARPISGFPADRAWMIDLLPKIRILILYSEGDNEFPSSLNIVFDRITGNFLDVESIIFLIEGLVHTLRMMSRST